MKNLLSLIFILLFSSILSAQESRTITGRIISEDLEPIPMAIIYSVDTIQLGITDINGYFNIEIPVRLKELLIGFVGMEWTSIVMTDKCQNLELIMMVKVIYDFISIKKINKKRFKRFKELPNKYLHAYEEGIFRSSSPCVSYVFKRY
jgi:hypothetical protein